jgi:tetratricopeptide (TPR) repeat protein
MLLIRLSTQPSADDAYWVATMDHYITALIRTGRLSDASAQASQLMASAVARNDPNRMKLAKAFEPQIALYSGQSAVALRESTATLTEQTTRSGEAADPASIQGTRRMIAHSLMQLGRSAEALALLKSVEAAQSSFIKDPQSRDVAYTRLLLGVALMRNNELTEATVALTRAREALLAKRGAGHWAVMLAEAYLAVISAAQNPPAPPSAAALNLADRVQRELGWQYGAPELAARLRNATPPALNTVPAVL